MKPLSWDEIDNGSDRVKSTIMDWKGIEDSEIGTLLNPFQPGQALVQASGRFRSRTISKVATRIPLESDPYFDQQTGSKLLQVPEPLAPGVI